MRVSTDSRGSTKKRGIGIDPELDWSRPGRRRRFVAYFWFVGWDCLSIGLHVAICQPNLEVHVPFGFFRIGWMLR